MPDFLLNEKRKGCGCHGQHDQREGGCQRRILGKQDRGRANIRQLPEPHERGRAAQVHQAVGAPVNYHGYQRNTGEHNSHNDRQ